MSRNIIAKLLLTKPHVLVVDIMSLADSLLAQSSILGFEDRNQTLHLDAAYLLPVCHLDLLVQRIIGMRGKGPGPRNLQAISIDSIDMLDAPWQFQYLAREHIQLGTRPRARLSAFK